LRSKLGLFSWQGSRRSSIRGDFTSIAVQLFATPYAPSNREFLRRSAANSTNGVDFMASLMLVPVQDSDETFDKVCSINNIYFWRSRCDDLHEIKP